MNQPVISRFVEFDHIITYTYEKIMLVYKNGKRLVGYFDRNNLFGEETKTNKWNFFVNNKKELIEVNGNDLAGILYYPNAKDKSHLIYS